MVLFDFEDKIYFEPINGIAVALFSHKVDWNKKRFDLPPLDRKWRKFKLSAAPISIIDHEEDEYDQLILNDQISEIAEHRLVIFSAVEYSPKTAKGNLDSFQKWSLLVTTNYSEEVSLLDGASLRPFEFPSLRIENPSYKDAQSDFWISSHNSTSWTKIFRPELTARSAESQVEARTKEANQLAKVFTYLACGGTESNSWQWMSELIESFATRFDTDGNIATNDGAVLASVECIEPSQLLYVGSLTSEDFDVQLTFRPFGIDMNAGVQGSQLISPLRFDGKRDKLRAFLSNC